MNKIYLMLARSLLFGSLLFTSSLYAEPKYRMHFFLPEFSPYTMLDASGEASGIGFDRMAKILDSMEVEYSVEIGSNHLRALYELRNGRSDGFFMASRNAHRDQYAVFSESVMINRWVWIIRQLDVNKIDPHSTEFKAQFRVASLLNTNTNYWLTQNGFKVYTPAARIDQLVSLLDEGKVDAIYVAEEVFKAHIQDRSGYKIVLGKEKAFGAYISKQFLLQHPTFMEELNRSILASPE